MSKLSVAFVSFAAAALLWVAAPDPAAAQAGTLGGGRPAASGGGQRPPGGAVVPRGTPRVGGGPVVRQPGGTIGVYRGGGPRTLAGGRYHARRGIHYRRVAPGPVYPGWYGWPTYYPYYVAPYQDCVRVWVKRRWRGKIVWRRVWRCW